jgi:hypothetical protein
MAVRPVLRAALASLVVASLVTPSLTGHALAAGDGLWSLLPPPPRFNHSILYDPVRERMVLFGGYHENDKNDVWVLSLAGPNVWTQLAVAGTPPAPRGRHVAIYDPTRDRMVIYGGRVQGSGSPMSDTWELSLGGTPTWSQIVPTGTAAPLSSASGIYDPAGDRMVVFGGLPLNNVTRELTFSGTPAWNDLAPSGTLPAPRWQHVAVYDVTLGRMLIFGGTAPIIGLMNDVWELSLSGSPAWNQITPGGTPPSPRSGSGAMFDAGRNRMVVFGGGSSNEVWSLDFTSGPSWAQLVPGGTPPSGRSVPVIYDAPRDRMLLYGGNVASWNELWALSFSGSPEWEQIAPWGPTPGDRIWSADAYDEPRRRLVMFGGGSGSPLGDLWELSVVPGGPWAALAAAGTPPAPRGGSSMIYDPLRQRAILFGGNTNTPKNDVWELTLSGSPVWTMLTPAGTLPTPRTLHTAIYDPVRDRMIVFGGTFGSDRSDTWALSLSGTPAWTQLFPGGTPPTRSRHTAIYDPTGDRMVVLGGFDGPAWTNSVWALSLGASPMWTELTPSGTPPQPHESQAAVYDPNGMRMLACISNATFDLDVWELTLVGPPVWRKLALDGVAAPIYQGHAMVLDATAGRIAVTEGGVVYSVDLDSKITGVEESPIRPDLAIARLAPNPSSGAVRVTLALPGSGAARIEVLDLAGRMVAARALERPVPGEHRVELGLPASAPPGLYMVCLRQGNRAVTRRLAVIR